MPNRGVAVYVTLRYLRWVEFTSARNVLYNISLPDCARARARVQAYTERPGGDVARRMLRWRYAGLHTSGIPGCIFFVSLNKIAHENPLPPSPPPMRACELITREIANNRRIEFRRTEMAKRSAGGRERERGGEQAGEAGEGEKKSYFPLREKVATVFHSGNVFPC